VQCRLVDGNGNSISISTYIVWLMTVLRQPWLLSSKRCGNSDRLRFYSSTRVEFSL